MLDIIGKHRSIRRYKSDPISPEIMQQVLEAAGRASTTGNMQTFSVVVTTKPEIRKELWEAHFKQNMVLEAPVHLTFCADFHRFSLWCLQRNADPGYENFLSFFTASIDALLASQNAVLEAEAHGLGVCYLGTVTYMAGRIVEILQLPKLVVPVAAMVMGYPDENPGLTDRLPIAGIAHEEIYHDYEPEDINLIYKEKEQLDSNRILLDLNQKETLAQIFTDKRYSREDNIRFSEKFLEVIHQQGFM